MRYDVLPRRHKSIGVTENIEKRPITRCNTSSHYNYSRLFAPCSYRTRSISTPNNTTRIFYCYPTCTNLYCSISVTPVRLYLLFCRLHCLYSGACLVFFSIVTATRSCHASNPPRWCHQLSNLTPKRQRWGYETRHFPECRDHKIAWGSARKCLCRCRICC